MLDIGQANGVNQEWITQAIKPRMETKDKDELEPEENRKVLCAQKLFDSMKDIDNINKKN